MRSWIFHNATRRVGSVRRYLCSEMCSPFRSQMFPIARSTKSSRLRASLVVIYSLRIAPSHRIVSVWPTCFALGNSTRGAPSPRFGRHSTPPTISAVSAPILDAAGDGLNGANSMMRPWCSAPMQPCSSGLRGRKPARRVSIPNRGIGTDPYKKRTSKCDIHLDGHRRHHCEPGRQPQSGQFACGATLGQSRIS